MQDPAMPPYLAAIAKGLLTRAEEPARWWLKLGPFDNFYGLAASPVVHEDTLVQVCDQRTGSFIIGLDVDEPGIGRRIADAADRYGVDNLNMLFMTPLPGTRLRERMRSEGRIALDSYPEDWKYYNPHLSGGPV